MEVSGAEAAPERTTPEAASARRRVWALAILLAVLALGGAVAFYLLD